ncbi:hypothetical protein ABEX08_26990 [Priestia megaterium]
MFTNLAACEDIQDDTHVTYKTPQPKHAPGADTISATDETMAPVSRVAQEGETDDRLAFGERSKHGQYYVSTTDAQFYPVIGAKQVNTQYIVVSVQFQRTPNEHSTVVLNDTTFTLHYKTQQLIKPTNRLMEEIYRQKPRTPCGQLFHHRHYLTMNHFTSMLHLKFQKRPTIRITC